MVGLNPFKSDKEAEREREIEAKKTSVRQILHDMHDVLPEAAANQAEKLKIFLQNDKCLPFDWRQKAQKRARTLECEANQRMADSLARRAMLLVERSEMKQRGQYLAESRRYYGKACTLGIDEDWRKAYQRLVENIMLSGGLAHDVPSRAKPLSVAPETPNRSKI